MKRYQKASNTGIVKKSIPTDTQLIVVNNTAGQFYYAHDRIEHVINLVEATSYAQVTLADLKIMAQFSKAVFTEYSIVIADILDDEFTLKDVYAYLDLIPVYDELMIIAKNEEGFDTGMFERFAVNSSAKTFNQMIVKMSKPAQTRLAQSIFHAYKTRGLIDSKQAGYDKVQFVAGRILKMNDDVIDVLRNDCRPSATDIRELL
ncbi:hypothetical protein [Bacillus paranthracis]|uniref:hypothetical protein n=1 Tax=Bacillus paranthracis TaxID=2026186 RepID=UPI00077839EA|nr:hypothetical protein AT272_27520 [Bacillus cereus]